MKGDALRVLATFQPSVTSMEAEFYAAARKKGVDATLETFTLPKARNAANAGDYLLHNHFSSGNRMKFKALTEENSDLSSFSVFPLYADALRATTLAMFATG